MLTGFSQALFFPDTQFCLEGIEQATVVVKEALCVTTMYEAKHRFAEPH